MHGLSFPDSPVPVRPRRIPPERAASFLPKALQYFFSNWFDQLGLKGGLQQFPADGKKRNRTLSTVIYHIDYIEICEPMPRAQLAVIMHQTA